VPRLVNPQPIEQVGAGLAISVLASVINGIVAWRLFGAAAQHRSITLEADAHHLLTDVWTSVGVIVAVALVGVTGWNRLDPLIALAVAVNILWTGWRLIRASMLGLLDTALPEEDLQLVEEVLEEYRQTYGLQTHALRSRQAGRRRFVSVHLLMPPEWTIRAGHDVAEHLELDIRAMLPDTSVFTHIEPLGDPSAMRDATLDRAGEG
jgi:cation diffusion facilitator family transporter